jgi:hypothetical protein
MLTIEDVLALKRKYEGEKQILDIKIAVLEDLISVESNKPTEPEPTAVDETEFETEEVGDVDLENIDSVE